MSVLNTAGLVGPALRGRCERNNFVQPIEKWSVMTSLSTGRRLSGALHGGQRYIISWSYFDREWSAMARK